jgi:hypothetical protein
MKKLLAILLLAFSLNAVALDPCYTGSWYDPERDGEGLVIEVLGDTTLAYFYTYSFHNSGQEWFLFQGDGAILDAFDTIKHSEDPFVAEVFDVGYAVIEPVNENEITFLHSYVLDLEVLSEENPSPWCLHEACTREYNYIRLTQPIDCE